MPTWKAPHLLLLVALVSGVPVSRLWPARSPEPAIEKLASPDAFTRERAETALLEKGTEVLPAVVESLKESTGREVELRFRLDRVFGELLRSLLEEFEAEYRILLIQRAEYGRLRARHEAAGTEGGDLTELQQLRLEELEQLLAEREPRVDSVADRLRALGLPALNGVLARRSAGLDRLGAARYDELLREWFPSHEDKLLPAPEEFDSRRYLVSLLWAWEVDRKGPRADEAEKALTAHLEATLRDLDAGTSIVRERAAEELFRLGAHGIRALEARMEDDPTSRRAHGFLLDLLRWRVRPRVYARTGMDFRHFREMGFRTRRERVFDYARTAGLDAIPTLRAIVTDEELEPSFFVRLGAAKALAGLKDFSGFEHLLEKNPEMTLKKPEVSRELALIQAVEHIREERYREAVEELRKILEEEPFHFRANYHIAFAYLLLKDYDKSIHHFEIARRIHQGDQLTLYNLACAYSLNGDKRKALNALEEAVTAGFDDADHIENDPDLAPLRDEPRYKLILEKARAPRE